MAEAPICGFCLNPIEGVPFIVDDPVTETSTYYHQDCPKRPKSEDEVGVVLTSRKPPRGVYVHITER